MNVLNVSDLERELNRYAAHASHEAARNWVRSVARNYFLSSLSEPDRRENFLPVTTSANRAHNPNFHFVERTQLPPWAVKALRTGKLTWFDPIQPSRRLIWKSLTLIVLWFNYLKPDDTRLARLTRISFPTAMQAAALWKKDVDGNVWNYIPDAPPVVKNFEDGFRWVKLVNKLQFEREGALMKHCINNGIYFDLWSVTHTGEFYSLRDSKNIPHVTMQLEINGSAKSVRQCKGHSNQRPNSKYQPYIFQFIQQNKNSKALS